MANMLGGVNINTVAQTLMIAIMLWVGKETQDLSIESAVMNIKLEELEETLGEGYSAKQAEADFQLVEDKIERNAEWLQNLSERMRNYERAAGIPEQEQD